MNSCQKRMGFPSVGNYFLSRKASRCLSIPFPRGKTLVSVKVLTIALVILISSVHASAQQKIHGKVLSMEGVPLEGVSVALEGVNTGTLTLADGSFEVSAKTGDILDISFIGYKPVKLKLTNEKEVSIMLTTVAFNLDEVILTGYTSQKVKEITGSVSTVKPRDLTSVPAGQVEQMLQGRVAGLTVITSGEPGLPATIRLHGIGNFGDVTPLYIIDGTPGNINSINPYDIESLQVLKDAGAYSIYGVRGANGVIVVTTKKGKAGKARISYDFYISTTQPRKKGLDLLNPQENADLIWKALKNSGQVDANGNPSHPLYGSGPVPILPDYLFAGYDQGLFKGDPRVNPDLYNLDPSAPIYQIVSFNKSGTDWFHELYKPALSQNHTVTASGGNDQNHYLFSLGYLDQQGTLLNTFLKRFTARVNSDFKVKKVVTIGENLQLSYSENPKSNKFEPNHSSIIDNASNSNDANAALTFDPTQPVYDIKGGWNGGYGNNVGPDNNPLALRVFAKDNKSRNWQVFGNAFAQLDFLKHFAFKTSFGGTLNYYYNYYFSHGSYIPPPQGFPNQFTETSGYASSSTWTNTLSYSNTFSNDHSLKILIGTEQINNYNRENGGRRSDLYSNDPNYRFLINGSPLNQYTYSIAGISRLSSFISQVNYGYKEKYFLSGVLRRDGSSIFGPENRYGWFPAVSAAWRVSEEKLLRNSKWLSDLKIRASWGKTGYYGNTDPFNQYTLYGGNAIDSYYDIYGISSGSIQRGLRTVRIGNPSTGWQEDIVTNLGLESVLWGGKLSIVADWYNKNTKGLLLQQTLPDILGDATSPNVNIGSIRNTGIDLTLGSKGHFSKNWRWDVLVTFSHYVNKITKLNKVPYFDDLFGIIRNEVGYPISSFFGYKITGLFKDDADVAKSPTQDGAKPGRFKYADVNGRDANGLLTGKPDGKITEADRVHFGNPNPKFTLGVTLGVYYKSFDFSTFFYGSFGNDVLNAINESLDVFGEGSSSHSKTALYNSWTPQNLHAKAPIQENEINFSSGDAGPTSYPLENGSYFRNKSLILGYSLSPNFLQRFGIDKCRFYVQAVNLFTITSYKGLDPELYNGGLVPGSLSSTRSAFGVDFGNYPNNQKQYLLGLNLSF